MNLLKNKMFVVFFPYVCIVLLCRPVSVGKYLF